ncbi:hypothetical protein AU377_02820 [Sporosarcina sp. HYO08]|nr:hypothetical protein AU377_02820 [Sporosarcina sp. HYO08]
MNLQNYELLKVAKDVEGGYCKVKLNLSDGPIIIRWGLDEYTYENMKKTVSRNYFDSLAKQYRFELLPYETAILDAEQWTVFKAHIRCVQGDRACRIDFPCSETFAGNLRWIRTEVTSINDLQHLEWGLE